MKASIWLEGLPPKAGSARERAILDAVSHGYFIPPTWQSVTTSARGHSATLYVMDRALRIGEPGDAATVCATATTVQAIADMLGAVCETSRIHDLSWQQATLKLEPILDPGGIAPGDPRMADTFVMRAHSDALDAAIEGREGLIREMGKSWIVHSKMATNPRQAINYGAITTRAPSVDGPFRSPSGLTMWQTVGTKHDAFETAPGDGHSDYSQLVLCCLDACIVDNAAASVSTLLRDPELAWLVSDEGPLHTTRYVVPDHATGAVSTAPWPKLGEQNLS
jgi:hypothetical protein